MKNEHPKVAVDMIIFSVIDNELCAALIRMIKKPFTGMWAFPGGLVDVKESVSDAAKRELKEKTGLTNVYLEQLYTSGSVKRDPLQRVVSVVYFALINSEGIKLKTSAKYSAIEWWPLRKLPKLAYDHNDIGRIALKRLQGKLAYTNIVYSLLPEHFTLSELQKIYESILGRKLDKRNFRKKIHALDILKPTKKMKSDGAHRPALLYSFKKREAQIIEIL